MAAVKDYRARFSPSGSRTVGLLLRRGGVVVYPTDTAYALGGRFDRARVVRRVLKMKGPGRRDNRKFTLVASSLAQVQR
ncbi:MAG: Sua5/YciO/YrdC/YwlC family protein, partial [Patescibacteria group bacterium]|nr:Sua5/YciO/YrdC/YwlC family protein [Patescibacteria group bacterium]